MKTQEALTRFLLKCEERGLSPVTRRKYHSYLRHFAEDHPELPTDTDTINQFLKKRKETPGHRGDWFKQLQAFYTYLEQFEGIKSPVPAKGKVGRPLKYKLVTTPATEQIEEGLVPSDEKLVRGGSSVSTSTSISTIDAVKAFITARQSVPVSHWTVVDYWSCFKPFIRKFDRLPLDPESIDEFLVSIKGDVNTRWKYCKHILALYHFLEKRKKIPKVSDLFTRVKKVKKVRRILTLEELRSLLPHAQNFQEKAIVTLLIDSKIRAEELTTLTREKVFPDSISVWGKTDWRNTPISPETYAMLCQLAPSGPLFRLNGKPMKKAYLRILLRRLMERAGLEGERLGPHILRHSASVQHIMFGGDLMSLKEELGHKKIETTGIYAELAAAQVKQRHQEVDVLGHIAAPAPMERARCYGCGQEIVLEMVNLKETECSGCHQVGKWYLPNHRPGEGEA